MQLGMMGWIFVASIVIYTAFILVGCKIGERKDQEWLVTFRCIALVWGAFEGIFGIVAKIIDIA